MSINTSKLVAAPMLQDFLIDKTAVPMAAGVVTCYHDNSRTTLKNWYYQTGTPGNYTYIALPNPLTLSAAGTISDLNGVDTIPFFYPWDENDENTRDAYYITVYNSAGTLQFTRANFPFDGTGGGNVTTIDAFNNLIINNGFWRNIQPNSLSITPNVSVTLNSIVALNSDGNYAAIVAPSQHDGFKTPDIQFIKTNTTGTDIVTFVPFPLSLSQPIPNYIVPEYYLSHDCTVAGSGNTIKCYQFPISLHINTLANVPFSGFIEAQNAGGTSTGQNVITIFILQDTGTGTSSPARIQVGQFTLTTAWNKYTFTGTFPATAGLTLGNGSDDALYLQVELPENKACIINFTKPSIYLTNDVIPNNDFQTYDQVDAIINSPRTGDIRTSLNQFQPFGWVAMNGGTIGNASSYSGIVARRNADTWPLFNLIWNLFSAYTYTTTNALAQMLDAAGANVAYGASAIADFNANRSLVLSQTLGRVLMGTSPPSTMLSVYKNTFTAINGAPALIIRTTSSVGFFNGMPIVFSGGSLPATLISNFVYYVSLFNGTTDFNVTLTYQDAIAGTNLQNFAVGSGTVIGGLSGSLEGEYNHAMLASELANHTHNPLGPDATFFGDNAASSFTLNVTAPPGLTGVATTGGITGFTATTRSNIVQPSTFMNMYIKL